MGHMHPQLQAVADEFESARTRLHALEHVNHFRPSGVYSSARDEALRLKRAELRAVGVKKVSGTRIIETSYELVPRSPSFHFDQYCRSDTHCAQAQCSLADSGCYA